MWSSVAMGSEKIVDNYVFNTAAVIGRGSSSCVYRGADRRTGRLVSVKVVELTQLGDIEAALLQNEVSCHKILSHNNILQALDQLQSNNRLYIISELCENGNLYDYLCRFGRFSDEAALAVLLELTGAVSYIHSCGVLHRDIKSSNVLLDCNMRSKLADFGYAGPMKPTKETYNVGSPVYQSPEVNFYNQYSEKSDVWALGIVFFEMLMGKQPFAGCTCEAVVQAVASGQLMSLLPSDVSLFSRQLLARMLEIDIRRRMSTTEVLACLDAAAKSSRVQYTMYRSSIMRL